MKTILRAIIKAIVPVLLPIIFGEIKRLIYEWLAINPVTGGPAPDLTEDLSSIVSSKAFTDLINEQIDKLPWD